MCLALTMAVAMTGTAFCSQQNELATVHVQLPPRSRWQYAAEACCLSGGGLIQCRYRVKTLYSPHSFIGDGPSWLTCARAQLPRCPPCEQKKPCGHKNGTWQFVSSAGWSPIPMDVEVTTDATPPTTEVSARKSCAKEGFRVKCPGEAKVEKSNSWHSHSAFQRVSQNQLLCKAIVLHTHFRHTFLQPIQSQALNRTLLSGLLPCVS